LETETLNFGPDGDDITVAQLISIAEENLPVQRLKDNNEKVSFNEAKHLSLDSSCAKRELSWTPRYSQVEAIHSTAKWWARYLSGEESASTLCMSEIEQFIAR